MAARIIRLARLSSRSILGGVVSKRALSTASLKLLAQYNVMPATPSLALFGARRMASSASTASADGVIEFKLADIGEGIAECELLKWYVKVGDTVKQFDKVCEVQSDKANVEITSRYDGVVKAVHYKVGEMAKVGSSLISIQTKASGAASAAPAAASSSSSSSTAHSAPASTPAASSQSVPHGSNFERFLTTPAVRRIAKENNIDLRLVRGTGPDGRILKEDMLRFLKEGPSASQAAPATPAPAPTPTPTPAAPAAPAPAPAAPAPVPVVVTGEDKKVAIGGLQRIMVQTMNAANAIPHFGFCEEIVVDELVKLRQLLKPMADKRGIKLSYMPLLIKAVSLAFREYPVMNAHVNADCTEVIYKAAHNIGVAMDTPRGLLVPNVKNVQAKSVFEIAQELNALQQLGKEGKLGREHLSGGTFTLSNIGTIGGTYASPVLVVPEVAIAALGRFQVLPRFNSHGTVVPVTIMNISYSGDHRVLDGATVANFSNAVKRYIEHPTTMLAELR